MTEANFDNDIYNEPLNLPASPKKAQRPFTLQNDSILSSNRDSLSEDLDASVNQYQFRQRNSEKMQRTTTLADWRES